MFVKISRNHSTNSTLRGSLHPASAHSTLTRHQAQAMASQLARNPPAVTAAASVVVTSEMRGPPDYSRQLHFPVSSAGGVVADSGHRLSLVGHPPPPGILQSAAAAITPPDHKRTPSSADHRSGGGDRSDHSRTPSDIHTGGGGVPEQHGRSPLGPAIADLVSQPHKLTRAANPLATTSSVSPPEQQQRTTQSPPPPPHYRGEQMAAVAAGAAPAFHEPRLVYPVMKKSGDLGVRLVGGNAVGIFVHSVDMDSPAFNVGLRCADQVSLIAKN